MNTFYTQNLGQIVIIQEQPKKDYSRILKALGALALLLALIFSPVFWNNYDVNEWIMISIILPFSLSLMQLISVDHKLVTIVCNTFVKAIKAIKSN